MRGEKHELVEGLCFRNKAGSLYRFEKLTQEGGLQVRVAHSSVGNGFSETETLISTEVEEIQARDVAEVALWVPSGCRALLSKGLQVSNLDFAWDPQKETVRELARIN